MAELSSTRQQESIENFLDEREEELEEGASDEETVEDVTEQGTTMDKNTNLHFAAALGKIDILKEDLESPDQRIDAENFMGWTPLMMAVRNGHIEVVKILLEKGADITKKNKFGVNTFNLSIANGNLELMEIVLRHMLKGGISRNRIQETLSPVSLAIIFKRTHLLRFLMSQGFDLNATTWKTGITPLMFAAAVSLEKIIPVLEVKGANKNIKNYMGVNYQEIMQWRRHGLENMRVSTRVTKPKLSLPPIAVRTNQPASEQQIPPTPPVEIVTLPIVERTASPISPKDAKKDEKQIDDEQELIILQAKDFVPQKVTVVQNDFNTEETFNDENNQNWCNQIDARIPPSNTIPRSYYGGPSRTKKEKKTVPPLHLNESPIIQQSCQYQSPFNLPCQMYMPVLNSPYGAPVPSPVPSLIMPLSFQNFAGSVAELSQNSPFMAQNPYQCGSSVQPMFIHSPLPMPDMNFTYDPNAISNNPNGYPGSPFLFPFYPPLQNVYAAPVQKS